MPMWTSAFYMKKNKNKKQYSSQKAMIFINEINYVLLE